METIAVYSEPQISTYGFNLLEGLVLYRCFLPAAAEAEGPWLQSTGGLPAAFRLVWIQAHPEKPIQFCLVGAETHCQQEPPGLENPVRPSKSWERTPVDLIYFQGPHFGDRYGILDFTLRALPDDASVLDVVCATATINLIFAQGSGRPACEALNRAFNIPVSKDRQVSSAKSGGTDR